MVEGNTVGFLGQHHVEGSCSQTRSFYCSQLLNSKVFKFRENFLLNFFLIKFEIQATRKRETRTVSK